MNFAISFCVYAYGKLKVVYRFLYIIRSKSNGTDSHKKNLDYFWASYYHVAWKNLIKYGHRYGNKWKKKYYVSKLSIKLAFLQQRFVNGGRELTYLMSFAKKKLQCILTSTYNH